jgi:hypothetical protein
MGILGDDADIGSTRSGVDERPDARDASVKRLVKIGIGHFHRITQAHIRQVLIEDVALSLDRAHLIDRETGGLAGLNHQTGETSFCTIVPSIGEDTASSVWTGILPCANSARLAAAN